MESVTFGCSMCCFSTDEYDNFVNHVVRAHRHDPNFIVYCGYPNCPYTTTAWGAFKTHISRKHKPEAETVLKIHDAIEVDDEPGTHEDPIHYQLTTDEKKQLYMGKYCLALEADHNMTQRAVDDVLLTTSDLIKQNVDIFRHKVQLALEEQNLPTDFLSNIDSDSFVDLLSTTKRRDKFYIDKYNLLRPEEVRLGSDFKTVNGQLIRKPRLGYVVPFKENLQRFISLPEVWHFIQTTHKSCTTMMYDICDASYLENHELFTRNGKALQIIMNTDDIEIALVYARGHTCSYYIY